MNSQPHILIVGKDPRLTQARKLMLGTYFDVNTAGRLSEAAELLAGGSFDLVVLCDTLSGSERSELARIAEQKRPQPTLLSLLRPGVEHQEAVVGDSLVCTRGPLELLKRCADTLGVILSLRQRGQSPHPILRSF